MARWMVGMIVVGILAFGFALGDDAEKQYQEGIHTMEVEGKLDEAIAIFQKAAEASKEKNPSLAAKALWQTAICYENQGKKDEQMKVLQQIVDKFPKEEALVKSAREKMGKNNAHPLIGTWKGTCISIEDQKTLGLKIVVETVTRNNILATLVVSSAGRSLEPKYFGGTIKGQEITITVSAQDGATTEFCGMLYGNVISGTAKSSFQKGGVETATWSVTRITDDTTTCIELFREVIRLAKEKNYREMGMLLADGRKPVSSKLDRFLKSAENPNRNDDVPRMLSQVETFDTLLQKGKIEIKIEDAKTTPDTVIIPYTGEKIFGVVKKAEASNEHTSNDEYLCFVKIDGKWLWVPFGW